MATMIEFGIVLLVQRKSEWTHDTADNANQNKSLKHADNRQNQQECNNPKRLSGPEQEHLVFSARESDQKTFGSQKRIATTDKIDIAALILFLLSYSIFNCVYWTRH